MKKYVLILIIILWSASLASAASFSPNDIEWAAAVSGTLYKGNTLTNGQYMVKAVELSSPVPGVKDINGNIVPETDVDPSVLLEIYKNGVLTKTIIMALQSEAYIDPDYEVKVSATGFTAKNAKEWVYEYYNPWATISIALRGKPKLDITVATDKSAYTSYNDQTITATVTVTNSGEARAKNVDVYLDTGELKLRGGDISQLHRYISMLEKGTSQSFSVILVVPELIDQKSYAFSANAKAYDVKDLEYKAAGSASIMVSPKQNFFTISKAVSKDRMYLPETVVVRITVANGGIYDIYNINVTDSMNEKFELKSNTSFQWNVSLLKPGQEWGTSYSIKPLETNINGFAIPVATAQFTVNNKPYSASSKTPTVIVNGPKIILNKTVDKAAVNISEDVTVTVSINNIGNIATKAEVKDSLPDGTSLVSGSASLASTFLELNTPQVFNYTIRMNKEGEIKLPAAIANYTGIEYKGTTRAVLSSERPVITVIDLSKIAPSPAGTPNTSGVTPKPQETTTLPTGTPEPTPAHITPGFEIVFTVIVLIFAAVYRRK